MHRLEMFTISGSEKLYNIFGIYISFYFKYSVNIRWFGFVHQGEIYILM